MLIGTTNQLINCPWPYDEIRAKATDLCLSVILATLVSDGLPGYNVPFFAWDGS